MRLLGDPDGALALNVRMAAHRAAARAGPSDIAPQQQQIDQHGDVERTVGVLGEAHAVNADDLFGLNVDHRRIAQRGLSQPTGLFDLRPSRLAAAGDEFVEAGRVLGDEGMIDDCVPAAFARAVVGFDHDLAQAQDRRDIAPRAHLMILVGDDRLLPRHHRNRVLRIDEGDQPLLDHGIEGDDPAAPVLQILEIVQEARAVGAGVLAEEEIAIGLVQIIEGHRADRRSDHLGQADRGRLVTHVGALRQIVVAVDPRQQRIEIARLQPRMAGRVEDHILARQAAQDRADFGEGLVPRDRDIAIRAGIIFQRMREPSGLFQIVVRPAAQLRHGVAFPGEKGGRAAIRRQLPQGRLGAVFAEFEGGIVGRFGPGARYAHHALGLVEPAQTVERAGRCRGFGIDPRDALHRAPAPRRAGRVREIVRVGRGVVGHGLLLVPKLRACWKARRVPANHHACDDGAGNWDLQFASRSGDSARAPRTLERRQHGRKEYQ